MRGSMPRCAYTSRWRKAWFPSVITSTPAACRRRARRLVMPVPSARFSPFATTKPMSCSARSRGTWCSMTRRPGVAKASAMKRIRTGGLEKYAVGGRRGPDLDVDVVARVRREFGQLLCQHLGEVDDAAEGAAVDHVGPDAGDLAVDGGVHVRARHRADVDRARARPLAGVVDVVGRAAAPVGRAGEHLRDRVQDPGVL